MKNSTSTYVIEEVNIVVYDKQTEHSNQLVETIESDSQFAFILLSKLAQKFKSVSFLQGGFVGFRENYSDLCSYTSKDHNAPQPQPEMCNCLFFWHVINATPKNNYMYPIIIYWCNNC